MGTVMAMSAGIYIGVHADPRAWAYVAVGGLPVTMGIPGCGDIGGTGVMMTANVEGGCSQALTMESNPS